MQRAAELGHGAVAIADTNTLAGMVRAHLVAKEVGIQLIVGCRLVLQGTPEGEGGGATASSGRGSMPSSFSVLVYPTDFASYSRLCRLLTRG